MKKVSIILLMAVAAFALSLLLNSCKDSKAVEKAPEIPLEDFFKNPEQTYFKISPSGEYFSYMAPYKDRLNIFVLVFNLFVFR